MKRCLVTRLLFFSILILCMTCGIDEIPVLAKPQFGLTSMDGYFQFLATAQNGGPSEAEYFRGFEVYYKFFSSDSQGETSAQNQSNYTLVNEVESAGFRRITYFIDENDCDIPTRILRPLIKVVGLEEKGTEATITINFGNSVGKGPIYSISSDNPGYISIPEPTPVPTPEYTPEPTPDGETPEPTSIPALPIRRGIEDDENPGYYKGFDTYKTIDPDIAGLNTISEKRVLILIYVFSYGVYNFSEPIYSDALCLNYIELINLNLEE